MIILFLIIWSVGPLGYYFGILVKPPPVIALMLALDVVWFFLVRAVWRLHLFERFLGLYKDTTE